MAVVFPYVKNTTWADGDGGGTPDTAAKKNLIEDGIFNAHNMPAVRVTHNANQSISTATVTTLAFNTERYDQAGGSASTMHDTVTNNSRLTCRYAGIYLVTAHVEWAGNSTGQRDLRIVNQAGTILALARYEPEAAIAIGQHVSTMYSLAVNDYVECVVYQDSGGALNVNSSGNYSPEFMMVRVA